MLKISSRKLVDMLIQSLYALDLKYNYTDLTKCFPNIEKQDEWDYEVVENIFISFELKFDKNFKVYPVIITKQEMERFIEFDSFKPTTSLNGLVYCLTEFGSYFEFKELPNGNVSLKFQPGDSPRVEGRIFEDISKCIDFVDEFMSTTYWIERRENERIGERPIVKNIITGSPLC